MGVHSVFLMIGCDDTGIHTEATTTAKVMSDAVVTFAKHNIGPVTFIEVAERMQVESDEISSGDLAVLKAVEDTGKIDIGEIDRYRELVDKVNELVLDAASVIFNFGGGSCGSAYNGRDHDNYVDGGSVSQWKIYQFELDPTIEYGPDDIFPMVRIYPTEAGTGRNKLVKL